MRKCNFFDSKTFVQGLAVGSMPGTSASRRAVYERVLENEQSLQEAAHKLGYFSTANEDLAPSQLGVTLSEATLKAYINAISGYVAHEKPLNQMVDIITYKDVVTKKGAKVLPMIGAQKPRTRHESSFSVAINGTTTANADLAKAVMPRSVRVTLKVAGPPAKVYEMIDDGNGTLLAPADVITKGEVNYATGQITLELKTAGGTDDKLTIRYDEDQAAAKTDNSGRTKIKQGYWPIRAGINKFEFENDLISSMIAQKTLGGDILDDLKQSVYDEQTLSINDKLVNTLKDYYTGNTVKIDLSAFSVQAGRFDSLLNVLYHGLGQVDAQLAKRTWRAIAATAYVVGNGLAAVFESMDTASSGWVPNNTGFVNGLVGFYKNRAVIRHLDLTDYEGYAIYKTNEIAPVAYGILLPATDLPLTGNFNNTNEVAGGIYSVDGVTDLAMDLAQRFEVVMPHDWMIAQ